MKIRKKELEKNQKLNFIAKKKCLEIKLHQKNKNQKRKKLKDTFYKNCITTSFT